MATNSEIDDGGRKENTSAKIDDGGRKENTSAKIDDGGRKDNTSAKIEDDGRKENTSVKIDDGGRKENTSVKIDDGGRKENSSAKGHVELASLAGQCINFGLIGNTVSDITRKIDLDGEDGKLRPKTIAFLSLLGISLVCQVLFMIFAIWNFLYLRNKKKEDPDNDCCEINRCHCCNCCKGTGKILFALCFILTTVIMALQVVSGVVGATVPIPKD